MRCTEARLRYLALVTRVPAQSPRAVQAHALVAELQRRFVDALETAAVGAGAARPFATVEWERDDGRHGGGMRRSTGDTSVFDRASVNVSQVHYDDEPARKLASASALSTIVHPKPPRAPSVHMHTSWTEMKDGRGYWRIMADLNPSHPDPAATERFAEGLREAAGEHYDQASAQGDRYFYIPALGRTRGVTHFYMEGYATEDFDADASLARRVIEAGIDGYAATLVDALAAHPEGTDAERKTQLGYHTLYLFQVLTLDRGTTSGLMVHADNDVGTLGSLPSHVDPALLASWAAKVPAPQRSLVEALVAALPTGSPAFVSDEAKVALASAVRAHYQANPDALALQARGDVVPPTVDNHR